MSALDRQPTNLNMLQPNGFTFVVKKLPITNFFIQEVNIPGMSIDPVQASNPLINIPHSGDHIRYNGLEIRFKVDEELRNYIELTNWMHGLGFPETNEQYRQLTLATPMPEIRSDISILIHSSKDNPKFEVLIRDAFPIMLSDLKFTSTDANPVVLDAFASFSFKDHIIRAL